MRKWDFPQLAAVTPTMCTPGVAIYLVLRTDHRCTIYLTYKTYLCLVCKSAVVWCVWWVCVYRTVPAVQLIIYLHTCAQYHQLTVVNSTALQTLKFYHHWLSNPHRDCWLFLWTVDTFQGRVRVFCRWLLVIWNSTFWTHWIYPHHHFPKNHAFCRGCIFVPGFLCFYWPPS